MGFANLHTHTCFSDGRMSPESLIRAVYEEKALKIYALTDHDTLSGIEPVYRFKKKMEMTHGSDPKRFIPGIELSLNHDGLDCAVHLMGLFPNITEDNYRNEIRKIDFVLGDFCMYRARNRGLKDVDGRIHKAFELNLDGIRELYEGPETVIRILRDKAESEVNARLIESGKENDIIQYPIPLTYQTIIDHWEELVPVSAQEKIRLYVLRPERSKTERLAQLYREDGLNEDDALNRAKQNQGVLTMVSNSPLREMPIDEGIHLLQASDAITILAHPAGEHDRIDYEAFDELILRPLMEEGLDSIEVYYPYDMSHRAASIDRYLKIAQRHGLLISGGTDFHGDGRTGLSDVKLPLSEAEQIISFANLTR